MNLHVLSEPGGVVVADSLGVTEGLEDRVGLENFVLSAGRAKRGRAKRRESKGRLEISKGGFEISSEQAKRVSRRSSVRAADQKRFSHIAFFQISPSKFYFPMFPSSDLTQ